MFDKSASARHKNEVRVIVTLSGQEPFEAFVFLKIDERLIDLLNDQRQFIPIKRADGTTLIAQKRNIVLVVEVEDEETRAAGADAAAAGEPAPEGAREPAEDHSKAKDGEEGESPKEPQQRARRGIDPYEILRIPPTATIEEIKRAYHARIKAVHPDTARARRRYRTGRQRDGPARQSRLSDAPPRTQAQRRAERTGRLSLTLRTAGRLFLPESACRKLADIAQELLPETEILAAGRGLARGHFDLQAVRGGEAVDFLDHAVV